MPEQPPQDQHGQEQVPIGVKTPEGSAEERARAFYKELMDESEPINYALNDVLARLTTEAAKHAVWTVDEFLPFYEDLLRIAADLNVLGEKIKDTPEEAESFLKKSERIEQAAHGMLEFVKISSKDEPYNPVADFQELQRSIYPFTIENEEKFIAAAVAAMSKAAPVESSAREIPAEPPAEPPTQEAPAGTASVPESVPAATMKEAAPEAPATPSEATPERKQETPSSPPPVPSPLAAVRAGAPSPEPERIRTWEDIVSLLEESSTVNRKVGEKIVAIEGKRMATDVRRLVAEFQKPPFLRKSPYDREKLIMNALEKLTTNERLTQDLKKAFELKGWLARPEEKPEVAKPKKGEKNRIPKISAAAAGDEDALTIARHVSRARAGRAESTPAGAAPVSATPAAPEPLPKGISNKELEELGLGTAPEKYAQEETAETPPASGAPVRTGGTEALRRGIERPPLHERGESGRASTDNPAFLEFLREVKERGIWTNLGKENQEEALMRAFESRGAVARGILDVYQSQVLRDLGNRFGGAEMGKVISAHIEKLSLEYPEKVVEYKALLDNAVELSEQEAELIEKRSKIVSGEEYQQAAAKLEEKKKIVEIAKTTVIFWPGFKKLRQGEGWGMFTWRKDLKEARKKAKEFGLGKTHFVRSKNSPSFMDEKLIDDYLKIKADILSRKQTDLAAVEEALTAKQAQLADIKRGLFAAVGVHEEVAEVVRRGIGETMRKLANPVPAEEALEGYERGEAILTMVERLAASDQKGAEFMDYVRKLNPEQLTSDIQSGAEHLARRELRRLFVQTLENPHAPKRLSALKAALTGWLSKERIGPHRSRSHVHSFIRSAVSEYYVKLMDEYNNIPKSEGALEKDEDLARQEKELWLKMLVLEDLLHTEELK